MNDKKQIEEIVRFVDTYIMAKKIAELIPSKIVSYDGRSKGQHLYIEQKMEIAKEMMKQGVVVWTREAFETQITAECMRERVETAREIYEQLQGHGTTYVKKWIQKTYGVEVEE